MLSCENPLVRIIVHEDTLHKATCRQNGTAHFPCNYISSTKLVLEDSLLVRYSLEGHPILWTAIHVCINLTSSKPILPDKFLMRVINYSRKFCDHSKWVGKADDNFPPPYSMRTELRMQFDTFWKMKESHEVNDFKNLLSSMIKQK